MTLTQKLDRIPPCIARILAKQNGRLMSDKELKRLTGWGRKRLIAVYQKKSWSDVRVGDVDRFLAACGLSWSQQRRKRQLLKLALDRGGLDGIARMYHLRCPAPWEVSHLNRHLRQVVTILTK